MKTLKHFLLTLLYGVGVNTAFTQDRWSAEFRPNLDFHTTEFGNTDLQTGFGFEVAAGTGL